MLSQRCLWLARPGSTQFVMVLCLVVSMFCFHALLCPFSVLHPSLSFPSVLLHVCLPLSVLGCPVCCSSARVFPPASPSHLFLLLVVSVCVYSLCFPSCMCQFIVCTPLWKVLDFWFLTLYFWIWTLLNWFCCTLFSYVMLQLTPWSWLTFFFFLFVSLSFGIIKTRFLFPPYLASWVSSAFGSSTTTSNHNKCFTEWVGLCAKEGSAHMAQAHHGQPSCYPWCTPKCTSPTMAICDHVHVG